MINTFRNYALLLVVFIHAHLYVVEYAHINVPVWLSFLYYHFIGYFQPASILAAISGYLFFKDFSNDPEKWEVFLKHKYIKRIKSILFPYFFWVSFFFIFNNSLIYILEKIRPELFINTYHPISFGNFFKAFFYPELAIAEHLWYLNNLLFVFIAAPLFPFFSRRKSVFAALLIIIILCYWYLFYNGISQGHLILKYRFVMFFLVGAFFGYNKTILHVFLNKKIILSLLCITALCFTLLLNYFYPNIAWIYLLNSLSLPVLVFYFAYLLILKLGSGKDALYNRSNHFLLYIIHPLLLSILCKILFLTSFFKLNNYFLALLIILVLSYAVVKLNTLIYHFLQRYFKTLTTKFL